MDSLKTKHICDTTKINFPQNHNIQSHSPHLLASLNLLQTEVIKPNLSLITHMFCSVKAMFPRLTLMRLCLLLIASVGTRNSVVARSAEPLEAFLANHCIRCHGPDNQEGELRIDLLSRDFELGGESHRWAELIERVNSGEMPPQGEPQPTQDEIAAFVTKLDSLIREGRAARMAARPSVAHYRLSRKEYQNTVYDLLGVRYDPTQPGELNEDTLWHGYERIGSELSLSPSHVDRYYRAADIVLDRAFSATSTEARKVRKTAAELRYGGGKAQQEALERFGVKRPLRYLLFPGRVQTALSPGWFGKTGPQHSGLYKVRIQASGIRPPGGQPAHLSIGKATGASGDTVAGLIEFDITAPEDTPEIHEFEVLLEMPTNLDFCVVATDMVDDRKGGAFRGALTSGGGHIFTHSSEPLLLNPNAPQMFDGEGNGLFSTVILDWIEWEGPVVTEAEKSRRGGVLPPDDATPEVVAEHLRLFADRAWRRPVKQDELEDYLQSYQAERDEGESLADAYRVAMKGVLTSRHFIYLVEGEPVARQQLSDWELASRLSFFLWSSLPDEGLFAAAQGGSLCSTDLQSVVLEHEVDRMLMDSRINRFVDDFSRQWLQLHRVGMFPPDKKLFPGYDEWLETSMRDEVVEYFREMFVNNLPVESFIDSDWTVANARLCDFYGLPEPNGGGFQRVQLKPEAHRGGLLTMGAVLGLTSDGTRHRPVHRGVWVSEAIFNKTPPPPPANVDPIEPVPPEGDKVTIRQRLDVHAQNASCAACHRNIDPLGFAFDQYDAIGQWRTREQVDGGKGDDPLVDASGVLPDGRDFQDANQFKQLLIEDRDKFMRAFIEHLCTYALRRVLTLDDADDIERIVVETRSNEYGVKDIVRAVALSDLMRKR
jgi:mono/diheme cytochrome c family protein